RRKKELTMKTQRLVIAAAAVLLLAGAWHIPVGFARGGSQQAPDFTVTDLKGKHHSLYDYTGRILFLNFWATWCPPCRAEIPDFVEAYKTHKEKGLEILGISLDVKGKEAVVPFVEKYKINYPVVLEARSVTEKLVEDFEPGQFIPVTIVIDKQGRVRHKHVGLLDKKTLLEYFNELSAE
ncbi:MAG: TlpA disulfide reductase family protein, partial [Acidobacteriota bacterium]